jgi:hypothetical protein
MDPISIINIIGFAFQCSELLVRGAAKMRDGVRVANEHEIRMSQYRMDLRRCTILMDAWARVWGFQQYPPKYEEVVLKRFLGRC